MAAEKDWLEAVLKRRAYEESPIKILELEEGSGPGKGENYLSKILKIKAKVLLGSGKTKRVTFLVKCEHETENLKKMSSEGGLFVREIMMYRDVLPKMQELLEEISDPEGVFWARCYDFRLYNRLVFEDLGDSGFRTANRLEQLSLNAALVGLRHFAKFHALSKILLDRGEIPLDVFKNNGWGVSNDPEKEKMSNMMVSSNIKRMAKKMETWGGEWIEAAERLRAADEKIARGQIEGMVAGPDEFSTLCHCDAWTANMMFKGDLDNPTGFRLLDLQVCTVNSPAKDVCQFLETSVRVEDRRLHTDLLLQTYTDTLTSYLQKLGYKGDIPTLDDIKTSMAKRASVSLNNVIGFVPLILGAAENAPDLEQAMKDFNDAKERGEEANFDSFNFTQNLTPIVESIIKHEIRVAMESGLI